jgi:hypothetical protein
MIIQTQQVKKDVKRRTNESLSFEKRTLRDRFSFKRAHFYRTTIFFIV